MDPSVLGGLAAAAPGLAQGIPALAGNISNYAQGNTQGVFGNSANQLNLLPMPGQHMGDMNGPALSPDDALAAAMTATPPAAAAAADSGSPIPSSAAPAGGKQAVQGVGGLGALAGAAGGMMGLQSGGMVPNGAALGGEVVPASTQGQMLTFDGGGVVPGGNSMSTSPDFQQAQGPQVAYPTPGAGFVSGFAAGQGIGRNLLNAWNEHKARTDAANYADAADKYNPDNGSSPSVPAPSTNPSPLGALQDHVEQFFTHLGRLSLNDKGTPNHAADAQSPVQDPAMKPIPGSGPTPAVPTGIGSPPTAQAAGPGAPPAPTPGGPPPGGPPAAPGAPPAVMGGNPSAPPPGSPDAQAAAQQAQAGQQKGLQAAAVQSGQQQSQQDQVTGQPNAANQPHSMTTNDYQNLQTLKMRAVHSAIMAGKDPNTVYNSMNALETAHFQSQITRYMSNAQAALQHGDMDQVKLALKNANYYLPNGQDINMKTATQADVDAATPKGPDGKPTGDSPFKVGDLMVQSPTYGISGHQGPEWQPVTMQTLQLEGQNLLDPTKVAGIIQGTYTAQSQAQLRSAQSQADLLNASARYKQASGISNWRDAQAAYIGASTKARLDLMGAQSEKDRADALKALQDSNKTAGTGPKVTMGAVNTAQQNAASAFDKNMQGQVETDMRGTAATNPNFGKPWRNPANQNSLYTGLNGSQASAARGMAQSIAAANVGEIGSEDAANIAAQAVRWQSQPNATHSEGGKTYKNYVYDPATDQAHVWIQGSGGTGHWRNFRLKPNIADPTQMSPVPTGGSSEPSTADADVGGDSGSGAASNDDIS